jgi:hypothetical protein
VRDAIDRRNREAEAAASLHAGLEEARSRWRGSHPIESAEEARAISAAAMEELFRRLSDPDFDGVVVERRGKDGGVVSTSLQVTFTMEQLRAWTELAGKLSKGSLDAGVEERKVRIDEAQGAALVDAFRRFEAAMLEVVGEALTAADAPPELAAAVRSAWSAALPAVVRAATEPDGPSAIDAREVGG